jgi:hypothetical protein
MICSICKREIEDKFSCGMCSCSLGCAMPLPVDEDAEPICNECENKLSKGEMNLICPYGE